MRLRTAGAMLIAFAIAVFGVLWYAFDHPGAFTERQTPVPTSFSGTGVRGLIVEPEDGRTPILDEIESAGQSIDLWMYILSDSQIVEALIRAEKRGVEVRAILEQHPYGGFGNPEEVASQLRSSGAEVKWSPSEFRFSHAKTLIFDERVVAILNLNLSRSSFESNREFGVISTWPADVMEAHQIFQADWGSKAPEIDGPLVVSPTNSRKVIIDLIDGASKSIKIYAEVIRDSEFVARVNAAERRGVDVQILVPADNDPRWLKISSELISSGVEIRLVNDLYIHAKAVMVDYGVVYLGSQNFTMTSLDENREIGIVVSEPELLARFVSIFAFDYAGASLIL